MSALPSSLRHASAQRPSLGITCTLHTQQPLLEGLLVLHRLVCDLARVVILVACGRVRVRVVLGQDARTVIDGEDQNGLDTEE